MFYGKRALILTCLLAMLAGTGLHFLYEWLPNPVTALLSPINESLWEHIKLIYWPYLAAALWLNRGRPGGISPWLLALPIMSGLMLLLGYLYHIVLGGEAMAVDIAIFVAVMVFGFWFSTRFSGPFHGAKWMVPILLVVGMGILIALFTLWPPDHILFIDLSKTGAWYQIPC